MPFDIEKRSSVLYLSLDTPSCAVNIFNNETARQLCDIFAKIDKDVRAIVFRSKKPGSFINGVGLMLAQTSYDLKSYRRASDPARKAFMAVARSRVPTIAAIEGSCYGCGVEFILHCQYRLASMNPDTCLYMTELNDYRIIPMFRSTWRLPQLIGLEQSIHFLLSAPRWRAEDALEAGLVDHAFPAATFDDELAQFLSAIEKRPKRPTLSPDKDAIDSLVVRSQTQIQRRPPEDHWVYGKALHLLAESARGVPLKDHHPREVELSAKSSSLHAAQSAYSFFYIRQMATQRSSLPWGSPIIQFDIQFLNTPSSDDGPALVQELWQFRERASDKSEIRSPLTVELSRQPGEDSYALFFSFASGARLRLGYTSFIQPGQLLEFEADAWEPAHRGDVFSFLSLLRRLGYQAFVTQNGLRSVKEELLEAYLSPLIAFLEEERAVEDLNGSLRDFGFVRWPCHIFQFEELKRPQVLREFSEAWPDLNERRLGLFKTLESSDYNGVIDPALPRALALSLFAKGIQLLGERRVAHVSIIDVFARDLLGFPQNLTSLCHYMRKRRVEEFLSKRNPERNLISKDLVLQCEEALALGRELYR